VGGLSGVRVKPRRRHLPQHALKLLAIRQRHHWPQARLAVELGCARSTVARWEQGERDPHPMLMPIFDQLLAREPERNGTDTATVAFLRRPATTRSHGHWVIRIGGRDAGTLAQLRRGLWTALPVRCPAGLEVPRGPLSIVKQWVQEHAATL
jgi:DNA-binding XRE family transcriptional regulator